MAKLNPGTRIYGTGTVDSTLFVNGLSAASSTATGALRVLGGVGVAAGVFVGGAVTATNIFGSSEVAVGSGNFVSLAGQGGPTRIRRDAGNNGLDLQTNSVSRLFIADAGNVGIGIVNPGSFELLTVGGSIRTTTDNSAIVPGNDGHLGFVKKSGFNATISSVIGQPIIFNRLNTSTAITSAAIVANTLTEYMRITSNGGISFGISGTAFGSAGQVLQSNGNAPPTWVAPSGGGGSITGGSSGQIPYQTGPNTTGFSGNLAWNSSTNILGVTGTVQASVFSRTGNVNSPLWTTTSPWFNVASNVLTDTTAAAGTTSSRVGISFLSPNFASTNAITVTDAVNLYVQAPVASTNVTITNNWGIYNQGGMYVNGNFGLGTTQYGTSKLSVNGSLTVNANDSFFGNFASGDYVDVGNLGATGSVYFDARGASTNVSVNYRSKGTGNHVWTYNGGSNEAMRIDGSGNVAINSGTTNAKLLVFAPSTTAASLTFGAAAGQIFRNEYAEIAFGLNNAPPYPLYIQGRYTSNTAHPISLNPLGGNVGIGDTSPGTKLTVLGAGGSTLGTNGYLVHVGGTDSSVDPVRYMIGFSHGNTSNSTNVRAAIGSMITTGGAGNLIFETGLGGAGQVERMRINGSGDVGIGYTSAQSGAKLSVNGAGFFNGIVTATTVVVAGAGGDITGATNITATGLITGGSFLSTAATTATSTATGALQVRGGVGIGGNLFVGNLTNGSTANVLYYNASTKEISYAALAGSSSASSLTGGTSGQIPYQTGPSTTGFMANANWNSSTSVLSVTGTMQASVFTRTGNVNSPLWTTTSPWFNVAGNILTDTTAPAGTTSSRVGISFLSPNFASTNAITITDAVNLYVQAPVASTNVTITNNWGIYNQGNEYINGNLGLGLTTLTEKFEVSGSINVGVASSNNFATGRQRGFMDYVPASTQVRVGHLSGASGSTTGILTLLTNGTERVRIDAVGNVIISGVTGGAGNQFVMRGGTAASAEGPHIVMGYGNNTSSAITGQANYTWNIDIAGGVANNDFRVFRQNSAGATAVGINILESNAGVQLLSLGVGTPGSGTTGEIRATNEITAYYSDRRLKENVKVIDHAVSKVQSLHGITYTPNELAESFGYLRTTKLVGLFADEVEAVLPEATRPAPFDVDETGASKSGENYKTIQYEKLVPLLVEAIKEQQLAIDLLKYELQELKNSNK